MFPRASVHMGVYPGVGFGGVSRGEWCVRGVQAELCVTLCEGGG